ncbi:MAG: alpha/beta hydrolase [Bacteroidetes bacterium]|nr:alpha/beta hydrolase [Bacteroidota bacterium]
MANFTLRSSRRLPFIPSVRKRRDALLNSETAGTHQVVNIIHEQRKGSMPTIVLGGFVPDATEQVFLMRSFLLKHGSIYYFNFPRHGFSIEMTFAQLDDLLEELAGQGNQRPVIFAVSYGAGLILEWLKRARLEGRNIDLSGLILISPIAGLDDLINPGSEKPASLLGRALKPYVDPHTPTDSASIIENIRAFFIKLFASGTRNKKMLRVLMTNKELQQLRDAVMSTIRSIDENGAFERFRAMKQIETPVLSFRKEILPLSKVPVLILYSEKETSVIVDNSPTRSAFESNHHTIFPRSEYKIITNPDGNPVQHASLIFHYFKFLPVISDFYRKLGIS